MPIQKLFVMWRVLFWIAVSIVGEAWSLEVTPERPVITYLNSEYVEYANLTALRTRRGGAVTINLIGKIKHAWGNNVTIDFLFYEFLSNEYRQSFIQFHYKICDLVKNEKWVGSLLYDAGLKELSCPYPAGEYSLLNMTMASAHLPNSFPFSKSRLHLDVRMTDRSAGIASFHIDITITQPPKKHKSTTTGVTATSRSIHS